MANIIEQYLLPCHFKQLTGLDCLGCGMQRSLLALIRGDLWQSISLFPALIPFLFTTIFALIHLKAKFSFGAWVIRWGFISTISIMVLAYCAKQFLP